MLAPRPTLARRLSPVLGRGLYGGRRPQAVASREERHVATNRLRRVIAVLLCSTAAAQQGAPDGQWPACGGDHGSTKHSPLDGIDRVNVNRLGASGRRLSLRERARFMTS